MKTRAWVEGIEAGEDVTGARLEDYARKLEDSLAHHLKLLHELGSEWWPAAVERLQQEHADQRMLEDLGRSQAARHNGRRGGRRGNPSGGG